MKDWLNSFLSDLHRQYLKPLGFRKSGRTFSKDMDGYFLRFHFQGSTSNGLFETWRFYINVGVEFQDLEPQPWWSYFAHTHWADRIRRVVPDAPEDWRYNEATDRSVLAKKVSSLLPLATEQVAENIGQIRHDYLVKRAAPVAV